MCKQWNDQSKGKFSVGIYCSQIEAQVNVTAIFDKQEFQIALCNNFWEGIVYTQELLYFLF